MTFKEEYFQQMPLKLSGIQLASSVLIIVLSMFGAMLQFDELNTVCFCTLNYLAWSWISFGISIFIGLIMAISFILKPGTNTFTKITLILQSILFFVGIALFIMFGARLLDLV